MDSKRSYLDNLNAGRQRRSQASLDQLTRSLAKLEDQLEQRSGQRAPSQSVYRQDRERLAAESAPYRARQTYRDERPQDYRDTRASAYGDARSQGGQFAGELEALRNEMNAILGETKSSRAAQSRAQNEANELKAEIERLTAAIQGENTNNRAAQSRLHNETSEIRGEIERLGALLMNDAPRHAYAHAQQDTSEIKSEIERLTAAVQSLTRRPDDKQPINALRLELEQARAMIESLAREETVRTIGDRWDDFERRMMEKQSGSNLAADYAMLAERIDNLHETLDRLPDTLPLRAIDEKFRTLSQAVEGLITQRVMDTNDDEPLRRLEGRMDEIARAIQAASNTPAAFDDGAIARLERRLDDISRTVSNVEASAVDDSGIARLESRILGLSRQIEEQIANPVAQPSFDQDRIVDAIESRLDRLQARFDAERPSHGFQSIEQRLDDLAALMDQPARPAAGNIDPLTVSNLEAQIANLSEFLSRPDPVSGQRDDLSPRLDRLERSLAENRDLVITAASEAAEAAVRRIDGSRSNESQIAQELVADLGELEALTRRSDERNSKTFEAIHDTLLKIVDRLGSLEQSERAAPQPTQPIEPARRAVETPALAPDADFAPLEDFSSAADQSLRERAPMSPREAAAAARMASLQEPGPTETRTSMLGGLTRKLGKKEPAALAGSTVETPAIELDAPLDPRAVNRPLEPGSGAPDLNAIMKRVRDERGGPAARPGLSAAANADFIANARRQAQAAAAEAHVFSKAADDKSSGGKKRLLDMLTARRKPLLIGAVAVMSALAVLMMSRSMMSDPTAATAAPVAAAPVEAPKPPVEPEAAVEPAPAVRAAESNAASMPAVASAPIDDEEGPDQPLSPEEASKYDAAKDSATAEAEQDEPEAPAAAANVALADIPADAGPIPLREAAANGDSKALFEIGARYADGRGVKADVKQAASWYEKSAEAGFAPAQYRIGNFYEKGTGVERDIKKAKTWYQLAANQGNASAMHNLAVLFAMGADGTPDNDSAARWFKQAADFGVKDSQFNMGILAAKGVGMPANLEESYKWFALVAKGGDRDAATKRDEIAKSLRPDQLQRARASVELWKPNTPNADANSADIPESWQESPAHTASVGDMKKAVRNMQAVLNKNGYDAGPADGVMGEKTKIAIKDYQKANGMEPTGNVDRALVDSLLAKN